MKRYRVIVKHCSSYPYSVRLRAGEKVRVTDKEETGWIWCISRNELGAWIPKEYLTRQGNQGFLLVEYISTELNAKINEKLVCEREIGGWLWCVNSNGEAGWIPKNKTEPE